MSEYWLTLDPMDVVSVRDGRPFTAGDHGVSETVFPRPSTIAGAVGAALSARPASIAGPLLQDERSLWFQRPRDIVFDRGALSRLIPTPVEHMSVEGPVEVVGVGHGDSVPGWISHDQLADYLKGELARFTSENQSPVLFGLDDRHLFATERRVGLLRDPETGTAADGFLYSAAFLRFKEEVTFACRVRSESPLGDVNTTVRFGGEGRTAWVTAAPKLSGLFDVLGLDVLGHSRVDETTAILYLATPACFESGWAPTVDGMRVLGGCISGPVPISTWGANGPGRLSWGVGAGSVYYVEFEDDAARNDVVSRYHGECLPQVEQWMTTAGFGWSLFGSASW